MQTLNDLKAAFYDSQRQTANLFEALVAEVANLNKRAKDLEEEKKPKPEKAKP